MYFYCIHKIGYPEEEWEEIILHENKYTEEEFEKICLKVEQETELPPDTKFYEQENVFVRLLIEKLCSNYGFVKIKTEATFYWQAEESEKRAVKI